jgi:ketosteroid isomerase-like protein
MNHGIASLTILGAIEIAVGAGSAGPIGDASGHRHEVTSMDTTAAAVTRLNDAVNAHDIAALAAALTDDCVFENTAPAPDGTRFEGRAAVLGFFEKWFRLNPDARFEVEEAFSSGDRYVVRWVYRKMRDGKPWHLRGVDILRVRDGKVAEKLAYVKG